MTRSPSTSRATGRVNRRSTKPEPARSTKNPRIAFATFSGFPDATPDDRLVIDALLRHGVEAVPAIWDSSEVDWGSFDLVVLRSTWDYPPRIDEFLAWVDRVGQLARVWNPPSMVRWNSHKSYLLELADAGLGVVPTELLRQGSQSRLGRLLQRRGWPEAVMKPAVGANASNLIRLSPGRPDDAQSDLERLLGLGDVLIQPFLARTLDRGERSLVFIDGSFSHATRYPNVLEVNPRRYEPFTPSPFELAQAAKIVAYLDPVPLYARLDFLPGGEEGWLLGELEVIEPELFFRSNPGAPERFAAAIQSRLDGGWTDESPHP